MTVEILRPTGAGDEENITSSTSGAGLHWQDLSEVKQDGDTTIALTNNAAYLRDLYAMANTTLTGEIDSVRLNAWARSVYSAPNQASLKLHIKYSGVVYNAPTEFTLVQAYAKYQWLMTTNPATGLPWTVTEINAIQAGISLKRPFSALATFSYCTQLFAEVIKITPWERPEFNVKRTARW